MGYFSKISEKRPDYLRHAVREGLHPDDQRPGAPDPATYIPRQPAAPHGFLPEAAFTDDNRHFALTGWGLAWLMGIFAVMCAVACGSLQVGKLKVYHLVLRRPHYAPGTLPTPLGPLPLQSGGFMLTGVPLVMGGHPGPQIAKVEASLAKIERALYRLRLAYVPVLRIVLAYVVSAPECVYEAMPPCPTRLRRMQRALDKVLTRALRVPWNVPKALLWMSVVGGGFGFPHLYSQMRLRHVQGFLRAMDSRSVLVRENVRALRHLDHRKGLDGPDQERLLHTMAETHLEVHVLPAATPQPAAVDIRVYRRYKCGGGPPGSRWGDGGHSRRRHPGLGRACGGHHGGLGDRRLRAPDSGRQPMGRSAGGSAAGATPSVSARRHASSYRTGSLTTGCCAMLTRTSRAGCAPGPRRR